MRRTASTRVLGLALAMALVAAACSGGSSAESSGGPGDAEANAPIEQIDEGSGGVATGPIAGLLTVQPSFGFGLFDIDPATGQAAAIPGIASVETIDRNNDVVVSNGRAFALGGTPREGQTFASDISIVSVDYATGTVSQLASLGFDRETDDSQDTTSYSIVGVAGDSVVVSSRQFNSDDPTVFTVYNAITGDMTATFDEPRYEFESDSGTCSGGVFNFVGLSDGRMAATGLGSPAIVDLASGEIELFIDCDEEDPELDQFVTPDQVADYAVFAEGPAPTDEEIASLLWTDIEPDQGFVEGGGSLWWLDADPRTSGDINAILGGIVQFDLASGSVVAVHPLGALLGEYLECEDDSCSITTIEQAELAYVDDRLVLVDGRENGAIHTFDPATGALTTTPIEPGTGVDYTDAELLVGDPGNVWLEVRRMTITKDDDTGRTATGPSFIERFDATTATIDFSADGETLFFS